ncbi:MAG: CHAT domain-containing protein [Verrucomicrobiales bacterium]|nr:CHAT domain-containing protein [Verrucomicrobiales bacterium]
MDQTQFTEALVRILQSGADIETIERQVGDLYLEMGFPEPMAREAARLMLVHGNDPERFQLEFHRLLTGFATKELAKEQGEEWTTVQKILQSKVVDRAAETAQMYAAGKFREALDTAREVASEAGAMADELLRAARADDPELKVMAEIVVAQAEGLIGAMEFKLGEFVPAMTHLDRAIEVFQRHSKVDMAVFPKLLLARAVLAQTVGDTSRAVGLTEQAVALREDLIRRSGGEATEVLLRADTDLAVIRMSLMLLYAESGDHLKAITLQQQVLAGFLEVGNSPEHPALLGQFANFLQNSGLVLLGAGADRPTAIGLLNQALSLYRDHGKLAHPDGLHCLVNLAELNRQQGDVEGASRALIEALGVFQGEPTKDPSLLADTLLIGALVSASAGLHDQALSMLRQSAECHETRFVKMLPAASENQRRQIQGRLQQHFHILLSLVWQQFSQAPPAVAEAMTLVLRRKGLLADATLAQRMAVWEGRSAELAPLVRQLRELRQRIANHGLSRPLDGDEATHAAVLQTWQLEAETLEVAVSSRIPEWEYEQRLFRGDAATVAQVLPEGSVLIEFVRLRQREFSADAAKEPSSVWMGERYLAFVLPAGAPDAVCLVDLGEANSLDACVAAWRFAITGEDSPHAAGDADRGATDLRSGLLEIPSRADASFSGQESADERPAGEALWRRVYQPLIAALQGSRRLILAPDSELSRVSFEALPIPGGGRMLDDHVISYVATGRDLLRWRAPIPGMPAGRPWVIADPDYDAGASDDRDWRSGVPFERLPGTIDEGQMVAECLQAELFMGKQATEPLLKSGPLPAMIHVATHGFFLDAPPGTSEPAGDGFLAYVGAPPSSAWSRLEKARDPMLRSGLALAGANTWAQGRTSNRALEDGVLTAEDVTGLDLVGTDLVVLSACETGLGEVRTGDGVYGLRRAFTVAGARTLVMSLWKVPDEPTSRLMAEFYRALDAGRPKVEALREAQMVVRATDPDPFFWGAFICQGDPGEVRLVADRSEEESDPATPG